MLERLDVEERERRRLKAADAPVVELPYLEDGIDLGALYDLADRLRGGNGTDGGDVQHDNDGSPA